MAGGTGSRPKEKERAVIGRRVLASREADRRGVRIFLIPKNSIKYVLIGVLRRCFAYCGSLLSFGWTKVVLAFALVLRRVGVPFGRVILNAGQRRTSSPKLSCRGLETLRDTAC